MKLIRGMTDGFVLGQTKTTHEARPVRFREKRVMACTMTRVPTIELIPEVESGAVITRTEITTGKHWVISRVFNLSTRSDFHNFEEVKLR